MPQLAPMYNRHMYICVPKICTGMFLAALFVLARSEMTQMPLRNRTEEWMNKQQYNQAYNEIRYRDETE